MWRQLNVCFDDWENAENTAATHLAPALVAAEAAGLIEAWFYLRKNPCWRVRFLPCSKEAAQEACVFFQYRLAPVTPLVEVIYEPEAHAFGGPAGMDIAHELFCEDSQHFLLTYLGTNSSTVPASAGRNELAILLCSLLFRAAGQDWYEQGDIWGRVAHVRQLPHELPTEQVRSWQPKLRRLMTVDTMRLVRDPSSQLSFAADWFMAFDNAGKHLAQLARDGQLQRGLRAVLAHHVLFECNRLGLSLRAQTLLAHTATTAVFDSFEEARA